MGKIAVTFKVMPESPDVDLDALQNAIREQISVEDMGTEDVAFGLKAVKVAVIVDDAGGGTDEIEETLVQLDGVQSVDVDFVDKL